MMAIISSVSIGMHAGPEIQLLNSVKAKLDSMTGLPEEAKKRRLVGWLQRRGHPWATVSELLRATSLSR